MQANVYISLEDGKRILTVNGPLDMLQALLSGLACKLPEDLAAQQSPIKTQQEA